MNLQYLSIAVPLAVAAPILAIRYLRPVLVTVMQSLCPVNSGGEFWVRCAYLLSVCGTLILTLLLGSFSESVDLTESLLRLLTLVAIGVFISVGLIARNVWRQVRLSAPASPIGLANTHEEAPCV
jgi:hypothetical protein